MRSQEKSRIACPAYDNHKEMIGRLYPGKGKTLAPNATTSTALLHMASDPKVRNGAGCPSFFLL